MLFIIFFGVAVVRALHLCFGTSVRRKILLSVAIWGCSSGTTVAWLWTVPKIRFGFENGRIGTSRSLELEQGGKKFSKPYQDVYHHQPDRLQQHTDGPEFQGLGSKTKDVALLHVHLGLAHESCATC